MTLPKTLITAILIVAAATQPVVAAIEPCCCLTKPAVQTVETAASACCAVKVVEVDDSLPACCAKKLQAHVCSLNAATGSHGPTLDRAGCCCVKPAPVVPGERTNIVQRSIDSAVLDLAVGEPVPLVPAPAVRRFEQIPGSHSLRGPSLLALLCVWRK